MGDFIINDFLIKRGIMKEEKPVSKKVIKQEIVIDNPLKDIIENKPNNKKVIEFLKEKMKAYEQEFLD